MPLILTKIKPFIQIKAKLPALACSVIALFALLTLGTALSPLLTTSSRTPPAQTLHTPLPTTSLNHIAASHLFGNFNQDSTALPPTLLHVILQGTTLSTDPSEPSRAIISTPNGQTHVYQVGNTIPGGAIVKGIQRDLVILQEDNQLATLKLPIPTLSSNQVNVWRVPLPALPFQHGAALTKAIPAGSTK